MKYKMMNLKNKVKLAFLNAAVAISSVGTGLYVGMAQACATNKITTKKYEINEGVKFNDLQAQLLGLIFLVLRIVGAIWAIMGVMKVVGSLKDDRPEDIKGGVASAIAGIALVVAPSLLNMMGILSGN